MTKSPGVGSHIEDGPKQDRSYDVPSGFLGLEVKREREDLSHMYVDDNP